MEDHFSTYWVGRGMGCLKRITFIVHFISLYYFTSFPSDHQVVNPGSWGPHFVRHAVCVLNHFSRV